MIGAFYQPQCVIADIYTLKRIIPEDRGMNWPLK
jgi:3-dehydroquinate synthetase